MSGIELLDTNASKISSALVRAKRRNGSRTVGVVLTLVIIADEETYEDALHSAAQAAREQAQTRDQRDPEGQRAHAVSPCGSAPTTGTGSRCV